MTLPYILEAHFKSVSSDSRYFGDGTTHSPMHIWYSELDLSRLEGVGYSMEQEIKFDESREFERRKRKCHEDT